MMIMSSQKWKDKCVSVCNCVHFGYVQGRVGKLVTQQLSLSKGGKKKSAKVVLQPCVLADSKTQTKNTKITKPGALEGRFAGS